MRSKYLIIITFILISCQWFNPYKNEKTIIIDKSLKSVLNINTELNSKQYLVNFSSVHYFDRQSIDEFLKQNTSFTEITKSTPKSDLEFNKGGFLPKSIIDFKSVEIHGDSIIINIGKYHALDGAVGVEIIFEKKNKKTKLLSARGTWIS